MKKKKFKAMLYTGTVKSARELIKFTKGAAQLTDRRPGERPYFPYPGSKPPRRKPKPKHPMFTFWDGHKNPLSPYTDIPAGSWVVKVSDDGIGEFIVMSKAEFRKTFKEVK